MKMRFMAFIVPAKKKRATTQHEYRTYFTIRNELYLYAFDGLVWSCAYTLIPITKVIFLSHETLVFHCNAKRWAILRLAF